MSDDGGEASKLIDAKIAALGHWRGELLAQLRALIRAAGPDVVEEVIWRKPSHPASVPVWSHSGMICTGEVYRGQGQADFRQGCPAG